MAATIVIPARYGSTRFPGKPLARIAGRMMIERVWRLAHAALPEARVIVATDDARIADAVAAFGGAAMMTPASCPNGTARCWAAVTASATGDDGDIILNLQGDAPITPPWVLAALVSGLQARPDMAIATPAVALTLTEYQALLTAKRTTPASGTFVTFDQQQRALYFSKNPIPHLRALPEGADPSTVLPVYRHIGLYAYRRAGLRAIVDSMPTPTPLEQAEQLEQLRWLEHGWPVLVVPVDYQGRTHGSVDAPEDVARLEAIIAREGELLP